MTKKIIFFSLLIVPIIFLSRCSKEQEQTKKDVRSSSQTKSIKTKENAVATPQNTQLASSGETQKTASYENKKYGFKISFPPTWKSERGDFNFNEESNPSFGYVSFSPDGTRFMIVQIGVYTHDQWGNLSQEKKAEKYILGKNDSYIFTSSVDPKKALSDDDCAGGGQFDDSERDRCKEVPKILQTFVVGSR